MGESKTGKEHPEGTNCFHAVVQGRVQRVGYRVFARESAFRHRVVGWVRNLPDGGVEIHAEGDEVHLTEFLTDLCRGPVMSHVDNIDVEWKHVEKMRSSFDILR